MGPNLNRSHVFAELRAFEIPPMPLVSEVAGPPGPVLGREAVPGAMVVDPAQASLAGAYMAAQQGPRPGQGGSKGGSGGTGPVTGPSKGGGGPKGGKSGGGNTGGTGTGRRN